jgi:hypothetical protein
MTSRYYQVDDERLRFCRALAVCALKLSLLNPVIDEGSYPRIKNLLRKIDKARFHEHNVKRINYLHEMIKKSDSKSLSLRYGSYSRIAS